MTLIIDDTNWQDVVHRSEDAGFLAGALPRQSRPGELEGVPMLSERIPLIPEAEWPERIRYAKANGLFIGQRWQSDPRADHQNGISFCWAYSLAQAIMAVRHSQGQPFVQLSPESLAEDVGYRNRGNYLDSALKYASAHGIASRATVPQHKITPREWSPLYLEERKLYIPLEWYDLDGPQVWAQTVTMLLMGFGCYVGYDWWGHAVFLDMLDIDDRGRITGHTPNSHGPGQDVWLTGSKAVPSMGSFGLRSVTLAV